MSVEGRCDDIGGSSCFSTLVSEVGRWTEGLNMGNEPKPVLSHTLCLTPANPPLIAVTALSVGGCRPGISRSSRSSSMNSGFRSSGIGLMRVDISLA